MIEQPPHEVMFAYDLQKRMRTALLANPRTSDMAASFGCDYPCGCYRVFSVDADGVEQTHKRADGCKGNCL